MLYYDTTGISSWTKCTNSGAGIAEITNDEIITCNNVSDFCIINVVLNLQTDKYMSKNPVFYSKENITIIVGFNHTAMLNYRQSYQLNENNGYLNNMVYNANGLNEDRITNTLSIGYVF